MNITYRLVFPSCWLGVRKLFRQTDGLWPRPSRPPGPRSRRSQPDRCLRGVESHQLGGNTGGSQAGQGPRLVALLEAVGAAEEEQPAGEEDDDDGGQDQEQDDLQPHVGQDDEEIDQQADQEDQIDEVDQQPGPDLRGIIKWF